MATARTLSPTAIRSLACQGIFKNFPLPFHQSFYPATAVVIKQTAGIMRRDNMVTARAHLSARRFDHLVAEPFGNQSDFAAMLDVDQFALVHEFFVPQGIRRQESGSGEKRSIGSDDAKSVADGISRDAEFGAVVVGCAFDRYEAARLPNFFGSVVVMKDGEKKSFDDDIDTGAHGEALAVRAKYHAMPPDFFALVQSAKDDVVGRGCVRRPSAEGAEYRCGTCRRDQT